MRLLLALTMLFTSSAAAQDFQNWDALQRLRLGDKLHIKLNHQTPVTATFKSVSAQELAAGTLVAQRPDVVEVERYRPGTWSRGKRSAIFAAAGFGGGFAVGAAAGGCSPHDFVQICATRPRLGAVVGAAGALVGAAIGAVWPSHSEETIYKIK